MTGASSDGVQFQILKELQRVNSRLDAVENQVSKKKRKSKDIPVAWPKISNCCSSVSKKMIVKGSSSESSSDDEDIPSLSNIRASMKIQKCVDDRIAQIEKESQSQGNDTPKNQIKKRGQKFWFLKRLHSLTTRSEVVILSNMSHMISSL